MADNGYSIPWQPLDIGPGVDMLLRAVKQKKDSARADRNEEVNRLNADINLRRVNDTIAREHAEFDQRQKDEARKRAQEQVTALEHVNQLARTNPGLAKAYAHAYGIDFREKPQAAPTPAPQPQGNPLLAAVSAPASVAPEAPPPDPNAVDAVSGGSLNEPPPAIPADRMVTIDEPFTIDADVPKTPVAAPVAAEPQPVAPAAAPTPPMNRLFQAVLAGQTYDLDTTQQPTGLGPKYDALYNRYLMEPGGEKTAFQRTLAAWEHEQAQEASAERTAALIKGRQEQAGSHEAFLMEMANKFHLTAAEQRMLRERAIAAQAAAAGTTTSPVLPVLIQMKEQGASDSEIAKVAAENKIPSKAWQAPVGAVTREAALAERAGEKREGLTATGEGTKPGDMWKSPQAASKGAQQIQRFHRVKERLVELIKDVEKNGERIDFDSKEYVRRMSLSEAAAAALRPYNELSSTDASMKAERAILGPTGAFGHGWALGADLKTLKHILAEAEGQQKANLSTLLRPGGGHRLAPALGGPKGGGDPQVQAAKAWLQANPNADANLRARVEAKIKAMEGGGG